MQSEILSLFYFLCHSICLLLKKGCGPPHIDGKFPGPQTTLIRYVDQRIRSLAKSGDRYLAQGPLNKILYNGVKASSPLADGGGDFF